MLGVDLDRNAYGAVERAGQALAAVQAHSFIVLHRLGAGDADGIALDLNLQVVLSDAGYLGNDDDIVSLAKYVERRIGTAAARPGAQPAAGAKCVERTLELGQSL